MRASHVFWIYLIAFTGLTSCKKEVVEDPIEPSTPVFKVDGTLGSEDFSVAAGNDNFYMSTYSQIVNGVELFSGKLSDGDFEIEMGVFNGNIDLPQELLADNLPMELHFAALSSQPVFQLSKQMFPNSNYIESIKWYVDGVFAGNNSLVIQEPGKYSICAEVSFISGNEGTVCNEVIVGYEKHAGSILRHYVSPGGDLQVWLEEQGVPISSVKWYFDDEFVSDDLKLMDEIDDEIHVVKAEVSYANGVVRSKSVLLDGTACGSYRDDFSIFENAPVGYSRDYSITLTVRKNGVEFTSINILNNQANFEVIDLNYYGKNAAGKAVFKISAEVECNLRNNSNGQIVPFSGRFEFGIEVD